MSKKFYLRDNVYLKAGTRDAGVYIENPSSQVSYIPENIFSFPNFPSPLELKKACPSIVATSLKRYVQYIVIYYHILLVSAHVDVKLRPVLVTKSKEAYRWMKETFFKNVPDFTEAFLIDTVIDTYTTPEYIEEGSAKDDFNGHFCKVTDDGQLFIKTDSNYVLSESLVKGIDAISISLLVQVLLYRWGDIEDDIEAYIQVQNELEVILPHIISLYDEYVLKTYIPTEKVEALVQVVDTLPTLASIDTLLEQLHNHEIVETSVDRDNKHCISMDLATFMYMLSVGPLINLFGGFDKVQVSLPNKVITITQTEKETPTSVCWSEFITTLIFTSKEKFGIKVTENSKKVKLCVEQIFL